MTTNRVVLLLLTFALVANATRESKWCQRGELCWPTELEVQVLQSALDPNASRILYWPGGMTPRVCGVPVNSPDQQPLYGAGVYGMKPVYETKHPNMTCFVPISNPYTSPECAMETRNSPYQWRPAFTVWALKAAHVVTAVKFATAHRLCVMVAGPGHDFLNRHSCPDGVFIRTTLMKHQEFLASVGDHGAFKFGPGIVFSEGHEFAAQNNRVISSGWASTVGIIGWSVGGGHGPFAPACGLGPDNILEAEIVGADGKLRIANATSHRDLWWAIRGGGGSTWGVITSITIRAHPIPAGGFTRIMAQWSGSTRGGNDEGMEKFVNLTNDYARWAVSVGNRFGGLTFWTPVRWTDNDGSLVANWTMTIVQNFQGPTTDPGLQEAVRNFTTVAADWGPLLIPVPTWWDLLKNQSLEPIIPVSWLAPETPESAGGVPSVLVGRDQFTSGAAARMLQQAVQNCFNTSLSCKRQELYQDITGNVGSPQEGNVSISEGQRTAIVHWIGDGPYTFDEMNNNYYSLGNHSYFGESAYEMGGADSIWQHRYWGASNYAKLKKIKAEYDPDHVFGCHHCVGWEEWSKKHRS